MRELIVEAKLENADRVQDFVRAGLAGCPAKTQAQLAIVADEVFSNIARYAYAQAGGHVAVRLAAGEDITLEFEDSGAPYDPLAKADPDLSLGLEEREVGGLGIFMVKNLADRVEYRREGHRNLLTIKKNMP